MHRGTSMRGAKLKSMSNLMSKLGDYTYNSSIYETRTGIIYHSKLPKLSKKNTTNVKQESLTFSVREMTRMDE